MVPARYCHFGILPHATAAFRLIRPGQQPPRRTWACLLLFAPAILLLIACGSSQETCVVLYCAQDQEFAESSLAEFKKRTGMEVAPKFDTEKDKSVSLFTELKKEKGGPRCDVFWNNEILNTIRLQQQGLLEPYESPSAKPYPDRWKGPEHSWHAFAGRARVLVVNTDLVKPEDMPKGLMELTEPRWKNRVVIAKPIFGTSATQGACLFAALCAEKAKEYYRGLKANGVQVAADNKQVAEWVGQGRTPLGQKVAFGVTDTDDTLEEIDAGHHVKMVFPDSDAPEERQDGDALHPQYALHPQGLAEPRRRARKLVDYLLSTEVESRWRRRPAIRSRSTPR